MVENVSELVSAMIMMAGLSRRAILRKNVFWVVLVRLRSRALQPQGSSAEDRTPWSGICWVWARREYRVDLRIGSRVFLEQINNIQ